MYLSKVTHTCYFYKALSNAAQKNEEVHACASSSLNIARYVSKLGSCLMPSCQSELPSHIQAYISGVCNWPWRLSNSTW
jgi:hypothetical protein